MVFEFTVWKLAKHCKYTLFKIVCSGLTHHTFG